MSEKNLVIVESPTKARTISKFLGKNYIVKASNGHVRDLPNSASEIPPKLKKEKWAKLGVDIENDFSPLYIIPPSKREHVKQLQELVKTASAIYLATDEDREGESISWHLVETLKPRVPIKRLVFHEITKEAIAEALESPRSVDENLVRAQETRRIIDRLYGYQVSQLLWRKMAQGLSAGRVQSVAVKLLVDRERERMKFHKAIFWGLKGRFTKRQGAVTDNTNFEAELTHLGEKRIATGKDFDANTGKLSDATNVLVLNESEANSLKERLLKSTPKVISIEEKPFTQKPAAPFVTSTLQQEANRKLRFSAKRTMIVAQQLYENGFITYMRTDSTVLSEEALRGAKKIIERDFGSEFLSPEVRIYQTQVKNAQEAHEAIRPAGENFTPPGTVEKELGPEAAKLYEMIWKRTVASQMRDAKGTYVNVYLKAEEAKFRASGKTISFPGFIRAYVEGSDDPDAELADQERILPKLSEGEELKVDGIDANERSTQPPARFTEGSLIKELERLGIGRPSTWATVVETVLNRSYAFKKGNALVPTFTAVALEALLSKHFSNLLDFTFTARLEDDLDAISRGEKDSLDHLKNFYFGNGHPGLKALISAGEKDIDPREVCGIPLSNGEQKIEVRIGRYGPFLSNGSDRASVPDLMAPDELTLEVAQQLLEVASRGPKQLGVHPQTGETIYFKTGRFGPYIQCGEGDSDNRPKMASLLSNMSEADVTLEVALKLLELPRTLGVNPENNEPVIAANGRYGPYVKCGTETRSINLEESSPLDIALEQALALLKEPKRRGRGSTPKVLRELGAHPGSGKSITVRAGRYGPYVTDGEINASLPKGAAPETVTIEDAVGYLEARAIKIAEGGGKPRRGGRKKSVVSTEPKSKKAKKPGGKKSKKKIQTDSEEAPADV